MATHRLDRINVLLRQEISQLVAHEVKDPRLSGLISITRVETTPDLSQAKVFVSVLGNADDKAKTLIALKSAAGFLQRSMRQNLTLRKVPAIEFHTDESIERAAEVLRLMKEVSPRT
jgi:ribosome-binding factor A